MTRRDPAKRHHVAAMHGLRALAVGLATFVAGAATLASSATAAASADPLYAGVGRADITPPTGYYMMGWVSADGLVIGQNTRLYARALVLREGTRKLALVAEDLNGIPGGVLSEAAKLLAKRGFNEQNILDSATHTHAAPTSFYPFTTYDSVAPTINHPTGLHSGVDAQLYAFEARQLASAIARADDDQAPAVAGWGQTTLLGITQNRSIEAELADYGVLLTRGQGSPANDPFGYADTIDPNVDVLRVDKLIGGRRVPIGMWSQFADHGTVNKVNFTYYNGDHHATADRVVEASLRQAAARALAGPTRCQRIRLRARVLRRCSTPRLVPLTQDIENVYGNSDEGDISAGLTRSGPAAANYVGDAEASAFLAAWRQAAGSMSNSPTLDWRWTRTCFCAQQVAGGRVDSSPQFGLPAITGSEEGRGGLSGLLSNSTTDFNFEGDHLPVDVGVQGDKLPNPEGAVGSLPHAGAQMVLRVGDRLIVSIPGEMTEQMGRRVRAAVLSAVGPGAGISAVVISGLANEYISYFTTPQEYEQQHYEGGSTLFGEFSSNLLEQTLVDLARRLVSAGPAPAPYPYDPTNGQAIDPSPFPQGSSTATATAQPAAVERLQRASFSWQGAPKGYDRPLDRAFVSVAHLITTRRVIVGRSSARRGRRVHTTRRVTTMSAWQPVDDDLGLDFVWSVTDSGVYSALWQVPIDAAPGSYRFQITANHYTLTSQPFAVSVSHTLALAAVPVPGGRIAVSIDYPTPVINQDLVTRPLQASGGQVTFDLGAQPVVVRQASGTTFSLPVPSGTAVSVPAGGAQDIYGNTNATPLSLR